MKSSFTAKLVKQLLYAFLVLITLTFLLFWWLKITTNHSQQIAVPDLSKMSVLQVNDTLQQLGLRSEIMDSANYNPQYPTYSVIEQVPRPGHMVKQDRKIYLALNPSGYVKISIPEVIGRTLRQGRPTLLAVGFKIGTVTTKAHISDQVQELRHKGIKLATGDKLQKTSLIDIVVGDGSLNRFKTQKKDDTKENADGEN